MTVSAPATAPSSDAGSRMSPRTGRAPRVAIRGPERSGRAVITATSAPARTSRRTTAAPMKPLPPATRIIRSGHQPAGEPRRVERGQGLRLPPRPGQLHRNAKLLTDGEDDATPSGPVHLGQDHAGDPDRLGEGASLGDSVLAGGGVQ